LDITTNDNEYIQGHERWGSISLPEGTIRCVDWLLPDDIMDIPTVHGLDLARSIRVTFEAAPLISNKAASGRESGKDAVEIETVS
jgi:hypothetical protein